MLDNDTLTLFYDTRLPYYRKVSEDIQFGMDQAVNGNGHQATRQIMNLSSRVHRVKALDSIRRKLTRDGITELPKIHEAVEDIIGIRIITPNKKQARELFEWFQNIGTSWFSGLVAPPKCVPYTIEDKNKHSQKTGYQAFHVTFHCKHEFPTFRDEQNWPVEIQIMSAAWNFWADYSRKYFYGASDPNAVRLLPYNTAIAKLLDSADDLMVATTDLLVTDTPATSPPAPEETSNEQPTSSSVQVISPTQVREWLDANIQTLVGPHARIPKDIFIVKLADELTGYGVSLEALSELMKDAQNVAFYDFLLRDNRLDFLPVYQKILLMILLAKRVPADDLLARINDELTPLGIRLENPKADSVWYK